MKYSVVLNRASGSGIFEKKAAQDELRKTFESTGHEVELHVVEPEDLDGKIRAELSGDCEVLVIGGGDGSIRSTAALVHGTGKILGILPLGTFNLEARDLEIPLDPFKAARALLESEVREVDVLTVNDEYCLCTTVLGFYPILAKLRKDFHGRHWWQKMARLGYEILMMAVRIPALQIELKSSEGKLFKKTRVAVFSPGPYEDSLGVIPQRKDLSSGKISAYVSESLTRSALVVSALRFVMGRLFSADDLTIIESPSLTLHARNRKTLTAMIDGEILKISLPCEMKILPKPLKLLSPS